MAQTSRRFFLASILWLGITSTAAPDSRDRAHQPDKVMDAVGVRPGMVIGEVGAGEGYFTFKLAKRVGEKGKIYANDIDESALRTLRNRCEAEGVRNIETIVGEVENPLLPKDLDMVFIVNAFHDLEEPVALLDNLVRSLKPYARVVIIDRDPAKYTDRYRHFLSQKQVLDYVRASRLALDRIETFLPEHTIYILRVNAVVDS